MTKRFVLAAAVLGVSVLLSATPAQALGGKLFGKKKGDCDSPCATAAVGCGAACAADACEAPCGPVMAPAPAMTTQTVTRYVAKTTTENKPVTTSSYQWVDKPYTYQECVTTPVVKKMPVTTTTYAWVDEPYTYTVCRPITTMVQKPVCRTVCEPVQVAYNVARTHKVCVPVCGVDRCGCPTMSYRTECVTTCETCYKTVMQKRTVTDMVAVPVTTYVNEPMKGMHKVCRAITTTKDTDVTTYTSAMVPRTGTHKVCELVSTTKDMDVTTYTSAMVPRTGTHKVCELVTVTKTMPVTTTTYEAKTETIQVPVSHSTVGCGTCADVCAPACDDDGKKGCKLFGRMKGMFGKKSSCGCN